jgi:glycine oxidase
MRLLEYDYLILGQGLAGTILSYQLLEAGYKVLVIDKINPNSSSQVAAGLVNPLTGRRVVKSWMADTLIPFAFNFYEEIGKKFNETFFIRKDILEVINSAEQLNEWTSRMNEKGLQNYSGGTASKENYTGKIMNFISLIRIGSSGWLNIPLFLSTFRKFFEDHSALLDEVFDYSDLEIEKEEIRYGLIRSKRIIFCEGFRTLQNPLWQNLPLIPAKGEILTIGCDELPQEYILMSGIFLIPMGDNLFRCGSTYEWDFTNELPSEQGKLKLVSQLNDFLKLPYTIIDHRAGVRPTVKDRRPLLGVHHSHPNVFLFNGMGTKGVTLIPWFSRHFIDFLENKTELDDEVNYQRFRKLITE